MKVVQSGRTARIYDDDLQTYDRLQPGTYYLRFSKQSGWFLLQRENFVINEKVYGVNTAKVQKVLDSFGKFERSLGVLLSGHKGIGKSLFAKELSINAIAAGLPVVIADTPYPGISEFIEDIQQEVLVLFDEFDKTFAKNDDYDPQAELLSMFDGTTSGKKLFVITCNDTSRLNDFLVNRPGRFHYHLRFTYPTRDEIVEYLHDKLGDGHEEDIYAAAAFGARVSLNYDCLRAIAFELAQGATFKEAIGDLNIVNTECEKYDVSLIMDNGYIARTRRTLDVFSGDVTPVLWFDNHCGNSCYRIQFDASRGEYDAKTGDLVFNADLLQYRFDKDYCDDEGEVTACQGLKPMALRLRRCPDEVIHYVV